MFTGIVEHLAEIVDIKKTKNNLDITLSCELTSEFKIDQSVSHNGICLTVVNISNKSYTVTAIEETVVTSGGASTTVTTERRNKTLDGFRFTAQIAKKYHDFTIRGGLIESSGGVGLDFDKGPVGLSFSAFDFKSTAGQRPHLKALGKANLTSSFYLLGGVDDIINQNQDLAWFLGAGLSFTDDDIKSLFGILSAGASASK